MSRTTNIENKPPLGKIIALRLAELNRSQKWLSVDANVDKIYLNAVLSGRADPSLKLLKRIATSLDIDARILVNALLSNDN